ncbi:MAG: hypothetical protein JEY96_00895 [Bacteroidales bacterium]|nr:hypothetical protein [Bacteroidales bacterium]
MKEKIRNILNITTSDNEFTHIESMSIKQRRTSIKMGPSTEVEVYEQIIETTQVIFERDSFETNHIINSDRLSIEELKMKYKRFLVK